MKQKSKVILLFLFIFNVLFGYNINSKICKKYSNLNGKVLISSGGNEISVFDLNQKIFLEEIFLPEEYGCHEFDIVNSSEIYFSFEKSVNYNFLYNGIAYYNIDTKEIKEIYISSNNERPPIRPIKLKRSNTIIFIEDEDPDFVYYKYDIHKKMKEKIEIPDLVLISKLYNTDYIEIIKKNNIDIVDGSFNLIKRFNFNGVLLYNPSDKSYYTYEEKSGLIKYNENGKVDNIIKIKANTNKIMNFISFDKTGKYILFEGVALLGFYIGVIDLEKNGKILNIKPAIRGNRYKIILE